MLDDVEALRDALEEWPVRGGRGVFEARKDGEGELRRESLSRAYRIEEHREQIDVAIRDVSGTKVQP